MRYLPSLSAAVASLLLVTPRASAEVERRTAIVEAVQKTRDAIVTVKALRSNGSKEVVGTGVIVDERGLVLTNKHVVGKGRSLFLRLSDGTELPGDALLDEGEGRY